MEVGLSEEEALLQSTARRFLTQNCPVSLVREYRGRLGSALATDLWREMGSLGWLALDGDGFGQKACVLLEEAGASLAPVPFLEAAVLAPRVLRDLGHAIDSTIDAASLATVALKEPGAAWGAFPASSLRAGRSEAGEPGAGGAMVFGEKDMVPWAGCARFALWPSRADGRGGGDEVGWALLDLRADGATLQPEETLAGESVYRVTASHARPSAVLGTGTPLLDDLLDLAAVAQAAEITGICRSLTERTVQYAKDRHQFGVPIGSFQAVQHRCVEMATDLEGMRLLVREAAWRMDQGLPAQPYASLAKAFASEGARRTIYNAHQVHGAVSFVREHDLYLYTTRLRLLEARYGDAGFHRARAASAVVDEALEPVDPRYPCRV